MDNPSKPFLIAGNWKMNLNPDEVNYLAKKSANWCAENDTSTVELLVAPAFVHIALARDIRGDAGLVISGQDCSFEENGAHTGDVSASMLKDMGCEYVILGHSERRTDHQESNELIKSKAKKALQNDLKVILCVGETLEERDQGKEKDVIANQLERSLPEHANCENTVIAYEPVWAIGTGRTASAQDVDEMHSFIHNFLSSRLEKIDRLRIIYGGSVKPDNANDLLALKYVSGALIGGASLKADSFLKIADIAKEL